MRSLANIHKTETEALGDILSDAVRSERAAPAVVVAYIFKDRINESPRDVFTRALPGVLTDRRSLLCGSGFGAAAGGNVRRGAFY